MFGWAIWRELKYMHNSLIGIDKPIKNALSEESSFLNSKFIGTEAKHTDRRRTVLEASN